MNDIQERDRSKLDLPYEPFSIEYDDHEIEIHLIALHSQIHTLTLP